MSRRDDLECKVYVGDLPKDASERELEKAFNYYGPIKKVWVAKNPPGFAFVEFEDPRDADDAVRAMDGTTVCGVRARVEHSSGKIRPKPWLRRGPSGGGRAFDPSDRCYKCGERGHYAYDCRRYGGGGGGYGGRRRSRSRSYERSRRSRSYSPRRSRSPRRRTRSRSRSRSPYRGRSPSRSRSRSRSPLKD